IKGEKEHKGTTTHLVPEPEIFTETTEYDYDLHANRVRELAFLTKGVNITIDDKREGHGREQANQNDGGRTWAVETDSRAR
ncbi:DNA topoisomerase IV subunit B, partial [Bacillus spizizenii]|nr:DNA topoisomerase IV subunit B [Bacillus spizizenii]